MPKLKLYYFYIFAFFVLCIQSVWMHKNFPIEHWRNEMHADKAGYYIYLPAVFIYDFSPEKFPPDIEKTLGMSFHLDTKNNKIVDKYFCTVSIMQAPFFLAAHGYAKMSNKYPPDGFSKPYQKAIDIAAVFYMLLGLYLLHLSLLKYFNYKSAVVIISLLLTFLGTNMYFYGIMDTGMSHIYSFFLFSWVLYLLIHRQGMKDIKFHMLLAIASWAIIIIRPLNGLFLLVIIAWNADNFQGIWKAFKEFFKPKIFLIWLAFGLIICAPQLAYWNYIKGSYLYNTYGYEPGFSNLLSPKIGQFLFAPLNGLFPYSFMVVFMLAGMIFLARRKPMIAYGTAIIFLLVVYFSASWFVPTYGCGCGQRNLVEYYALLIFPLCALVNYIFTLRSKYILISLLFLIAFLNFKIVYHYWGCYFYDTWDWKYYVDLIRYNNKNWGPY